MAETVYFGGGGKISLAYAEPGTLTIDVAGSTPKVVVTPNVEFSGTLALTGGLDMTNDVITNIGAAGTDFTATGGLTLADALTVSAGGASITGTLTMGTAVSKIVPGATSWGVRNNADSADNIIITNAGAVTFRSTVGGITTLTATTLAGTLSTAAQTNVTSLGTLAALTVSGTASFTNASPFSMTNAQVVTVALTAQTVGIATLTIPDFANVSDTFAFLTLAQELNNKTLNASVGKGTWTASGTWTLPAITLGGTVSGTPTWASSQAITLSTAAQASVTSLGTLTALAVDDITINGNTISSAGASTLAITPTAGQTITFDGTVTLDAGVIAGATSITSTTFVGNLTGDASGSAATVTGATQAAITTLANLVTVGALASGSIASGFGAINIGANALTCGAINSQTISVAANFTGDVTIADQLIVSGAGPHAIGGAVDNNMQFILRGSFGGSAGASIAFGVTSTLTCGANHNPAAVIYVAPTIVEGTGNHPLLASVSLEIPTVTVGTATVTNTANLYIAGAMSATVTGANYALWVDAGLARFDGGIESVSATAKLGYGTGSGGTVTQATSKATAFTLSTVTGQITTAADALAADAIVSATWTNTAIAATDMVVINHVSGGTVGAYVFNVQCGAGTATLNIANRSAGSLSEALVLQFAVLKGVTA